MQLRTHLKRTAHRNNKLMPIGVALALTLALAILVTVAITWAGLRFLHFQRFKPEPQLSADTLFNLLKIAFAVAAGIGGVVALVTAYRRQRITEMTERREGTRLFQRTVHHRRRPARARSLSGPPRRCLRHGRPSRRLARPAANMRRRALRLPADALQTQTRRRRPGRRPHHLACEVRHTVIRVIKDHLQPGKTRAPTLVPWHGLDLDFTGVVFDGGDFRCVQFTGGEIDFTGAQFTGPIVNFDNAEFTGGTVDFFGAEFADGEVIFNSAMFSGGTVLFHGTFAGAEVGFYGALFTGGTVDFGQAEFTGGTVNFSASKFVGSTVSFEGAKFVGADVSFYGADFAGAPVDLSHAAKWTEPPIFDQQVSALSGLLLPPGQRQRRSTLA